jgi:hypothetical protein
MNNNRPEIVDSFPEKCIPSRNVLWLFLFLAMCLAEVNANASLYVNQWHQDYPSAASYNNRIIRSRHSLLSTQNEPFHHDLVVSVARKAPKRSRSLASTKPSSRVSFDRLRPKEKVFTGTMRVLTDALGDYILGFCAGYAAGAIVGLPALIFRPAGTGTSQILSTEIKGRLGRMDVRSLRWALGLGEILGTFKGCDTAVHLIRYPKKDEWNQVFGCASAGAILARNREYCIVACSCDPSSTSPYFLTFPCHSCRGPDGNGTGGASLGCCNLRFGNDRPPSSIEIQGTRVLPSKIWAKSMVTKVLQMLANPLLPCILLCNRPFLPNSFYRDIGQSSCLILVLRRFSSLLQSASF